MDIKKLMCGNWIYNSVMKRNEQVKIVDSIFNKITTVYVDGNRLVESELSHDKVEPIPLTKEVLKKNGFDGEPYAYYQLDEFKYIQYYFYENRFRVICEGVDEWDNHSYKKDIVFESRPNSVHEFQQSLCLSKTDIEFGQDFVV